MNESENHHSEEVSREEMTNLVENDVSVFVQRVGVADEPLVEVAGGDVADASLLPIKDLLLTDLVAAEATERPVSGPADLSSDARRRQSSRLRDDNVAVLVASGVVFQN